MSISPMPPNPWPSPPNRSPPRRPPRRKPPIMPPHPKPGRWGWVGEEKPREGADGLDGFTGLAGADGLRGAEYDREPRLPPELPPPTRASAAVTMSEVKNSARIAPTMEP